jgi:PIN domain
MDLLPPVNHIFVDFENVHEVELSIIGQKSVSLTVLLGPKDTKLKTNLVEKILQHADSVHLIRLTSSGRNALDFTLAYYVGRAAVLDPSGFFYIISGDTGYDPLIAHLRSNHVRAHRHPDFTSLQSLLNPLSPAVAAPASSPAPAPAKAVKIPKPPKAPKPSTPIALPLDERASHALEHLRSHTKNRPARENTLVSHMRTLFGNKITEEEATTVVEALRRAGHIAITDKGRVTYRL